MAFAVNRPARLSLGV